MFETLSLAVTIFSKYFEDLGDLQNVFFQTHAEGISVNK